MRRNLRPNTPIFNPDKVTGAIITGNTPAGILLPSAMTVIHTVAGYSGCRVALEGDLLFLSRDTEFSVFDISNRAAPSLLGDITDATVQYGNGIWPDGNYVYLCRTFNNYSVVDVSTPATPVVVGDTAGFNPISWHTKIGNILYSAAGGRLQRLDVSTPSAPSVTHSLALNGGEPNYYGDYISGAGVIVTTHEDSVFIVTPGAPPVETYMWTPGTWDPATSNSSARVRQVGSIYALLGTVGNNTINVPYRLALVDVSVPTSPTLAWSEPNDVTPTVSLLNDNEVIYQVRGNSTINAWNFNAPLSPTALFTFSDAALAGAADAAHTDDYIYVSTTGGLRTIQITR